MAKRALLRTASLHKENAPFYFMLDGPVRRISILQQRKTVFAHARTHTVLSFSSATKQESADTVIYFDKLFYTAEITFSRSTVARHNAGIITSHVRGCN